MESCPCSYAGRFGLGGQPFSAHHPFNSASVEYFEFLLWDWHTLSHPLSKKLLDAYSCFHSSFLSGFYQQYLLATGMRLLFGTIQVLWSVLIAVGECDLCLFYLTFLSRNFSKNLVQSGRQYYQSRYKNEQARALDVQLVVRSHYFGPPTRLEIYYENVRARVRAEAQVGASLLIASFTFICSKYLTLWDNKIIAVWW